MIAGPHPLSNSTMWAIDHFPNLEDFSQASYGLGFSHIELNHAVNSAMLLGIDLANHPISSIHEPCPADISVTELKDRDWLISSLDEEKRRQGVQAIQRTIDLAGTLGVGVVIVHPGQVRNRDELEKELYTLYKTGQEGNERVQQIRDRLVIERAREVGPHLEAVVKSLQELLEYAHPRRVKLGLENRYHYVDIPLPDEMEALLGLAGPDAIGMWYDVGHAQTLDRLGFYPYTEWLERFGERILGVHLHDVVGINDHLAPGLGEVDFAEVARYLPPGAIRTCELGNRTKPDEIQAGLRYLAAKGCLL